MTKYRVEISQTCDMRWRVIVEAANEEQAEERAIARVFGDDDDGGLEPIEHFIADSMEDPEVMSCDPINDDAVVS
jgi:hypothetical protein